MADPTRPVQDAIIDPVWGQWVHDHIVNPDRLLQQVTKPSTDAGYSNTEYSIPGLGLTVPAAPTGRIHQVRFGIRVAVTTAAAGANNVLVITWKAGAVVKSVQFPFINNMSAYGFDLMGSFPATGIAPGASITMYTNTDGTGRYSVLASSWSALHDVT